MIEHNLGLGLIPRKKDEVDKRDLLYSTVFKVNREETRYEIDAREIRNQFKKGVCAGFGCAYAKSHNERLNVSPLFIYIMAKHLDRFGIKEEGTDIISVVKACQKYGSLKEEDLPYSLYKDAPKMQFPEISSDLMKKALDMKIEGYVKITNLAELKDNILHDKMVVGGFLVGLESFFNPEFLDNGDAVVKLPQGRIAGHCMSICGFDDDMEHTFKDETKYKGFVKIVQSYGTEASIREFGEPDAKIWTKSGYGWIPYDYVFGELNFTGIEGQETPYVNEMYALIDEFPTNIKMIDDGNKNITPFIRDGRTMLPLRFIGEILGAKVDYRETEFTKTITIEYKNKKVILEPNTHEYDLNGIIHVLDVCPTVIEGRTFIPIRFLAEIFGSKVKWFENEERIELQNEEKIIEMWIGVNQARIIDKQ